MKRPLGSWTRLSNSNQCCGVYWSTGQWILCIADETFTEFLEDLADKLKDELSTTFLSEIKVPYVMNIRHLLQVNYDA